MAKKTSVKSSSAGLAAGVGFFHKTLDHDPSTGLIKNPSDFSKFQKIAKKGSDFDQTSQTPGAAKLINPQAGWSHEHLGPDPAEMKMHPPPAATSDATAAEMTELFWMALLRDKFFEDFTDTDVDLEAATKDLADVFGKAKGEFLPLKDLPAKGNNPDFRTQTIFRSGLPDEEYGPLVSQFFLHDIAYGTQIILQKQFPYLAGADYLKSWKDWQKAQSYGTDADDHDYPGDNTGDKYYENDYKTLPGLKRIRNMRDLARFVNKDALHQAYFNAALLLNNWNAPLGAGNPYNTKSGGIKKQRPFGTLGGPHLLTLVSEVASRALKVVWRQKWGVYLRQRPEAYGGLMEAQKKHGVNINLPEFVFNTEAAKRIYSKQSNYLLPLAFSAGSPAHPSYGAGHATVAGACVTILKAWFDAKRPYSEIIKKGAAAHPITFMPVQIVRPDKNGSDVLPGYTGTDAAKMTMEGELNKLASNVAMGRSMGGVHWRTDNTRSLRLGEKIATIVLRRESKDYQERPSWTYTNFDDEEVTIKPNGNVSVPKNSDLEKFYNSRAFAPFK
jgi:hypothetical protein